MPDHVTPEQIGQYRSKSMPPAALLAFDNHLARCEKCREQIADQERGSNMLSGLAGAASEHLSYEQMVEYIDGKSGALDREAVESHAEMCGRCAAELQNLAAFASEMAVAADPAPLASESPGLGAISFSKTELRIKLPIEQEKGNKDQ